MIESRNQAYLSQQLVKIVKDLDLVENLSEISLRPINNQELEEILDELEFSSFKRNLLRLTTQD